MDPISTLFSIYLETVTNDIHQTVSDVMGAELQAIVINYDDMDIPFQYQIWKVREQSVCESYREHIAIYSACTVKAKALFNDLCSELSKTTNEHWKYKKTKNMYCNAAVSYQPTIANISGATEETPLEIARQRCSSATINALGSTDSGLISQRDAACKEYNDLK